MPVSKPAWVFIAPLAPRGGRLTLDESELTVRAGILGSATVPLEAITKVSLMDWPWWWGPGVRVIRRSVAFVFRSGVAVRIDLAKPIRVRAPLGWTTSTLIVRVAEPEALVRALAGGSDVDEGVT